MSPDGNSLVLATAGDARRLALFVHDLERGVTRRLNTGGSRALAVWSPDGQELAYESVEHEAIYRISASGGDPMPLGVGAPDAELVDWASNGDVLYSTDGKYAAMTAEGAEVPVLDLLTAISYGAISPDARWIAYATLETGRREVYVRPYPGPGAATLVSVGGGGSPAWSRDGTRLFYRGPGDVLMAVDVKRGNTFDAGLPSWRIDSWQYAGTVPVRSYDTAPDGGFFALTTDPRGARERFAVDEIHLFLNVSSDLERRFAERAGDGR